MKKQFEFTAYEILTIHRFMNEFREDFAKEKKFHALNEAFKALENQTKKLSVADIEEAWAERTLNEEFGFEPS